MKNDLLANRHIGISKKDEEQMLRKIGVSSLDELIDKTIPANIRLKEPLALPEAMTEYEFGQHIVVQGGTFLNDAILRSFEQEIGRNVTRPAISGLMGAYGAALHAKDNRCDTTTLIGTDILIAEKKCGRAVGSFSFKKISFFVAP